MNKTELRDAVAKKTQMTQADMGIILDVVLDTIKEGLVEDGRVALVNFGTFEVRDRAARKGRNPQTGEEIEIAARKAPAFRPSENLKEIVNK